MEHDGRLLEGRIEPVPDRERCVAQADTSKRLTIVTSQLTSREGEDREHVREVCDVYLKPIDRSQVLTISEVGELM